jgi:hypothetical protein
MVLPSQGVRYCAQGCKALGEVMAVSLMIPLGHQATLHSIYAFYPYRALQVELTEHLWRKHEIEHYQKQRHWYRSTCLALLNSRASQCDEPPQGDSTSIKPMDDEHLTKFGTNGNKVS